MKSNKMAKINRYSGIEKKLSRSGFLFVLPGLLILLFFLAYPVYTAFSTSLTKFDIVSPVEWVGFKNYIDIFGDSDFINSLIVTLKYLVGSAAPLIIFSFLFAVILNKQLAGFELFKVTIFMPVIISQVVAAVIFRYLFHPYGLVNEFFMSIGIMNEYVKWLGDERYVLWTYIILATWKDVGYFMVLFLASLQTINPDYYEVAVIDGASTIQKHYHITLPLIKPTIAFALIMTFVRMLNLFAPFYVMTYGGPAGSSEVISLLIYKTGFDYLKMGKASAMSVVLLLIGVVIVYFLNRGMAKENG
jgi:ABC-type sugar transport system permease subunit